MQYINILTIHKEPNYGACLQAYALYHAIEQLGGRPRMINLSLQYRHRTYNMANRMLVGANNWLKGYGHCYRLAEEFSRKHCPNQVGDFHTLEQLKRYNWNPSDQFLVGSDQVWNPEITHNLRMAYVLDFLPASYTNRYSYASSFGNISDKIQRAIDLKVKETIGSFRQVAVRESFGVTFLREQGIPSTEVIDPTLLLSDYSQLLRTEPMPGSKLLFLSLGASPTMEQFVGAVSQRLGMAVEVHYGYLQPSPMENRKWLSVEDWLLRIASSKLIVTDSFHAVVFAIQMQRPFFYYASAPSKVFRIQNLLEKLGLSDRIVSNPDEVTAIDIDYSTVNERLAVLRQESWSYLSSIVQKQ